MLQEFPYSYIHRGEVVVTGLEPAIPSRLEFWGLRNGLRLPFRHTTKWTCRESNAGLDNCCWTPSLNQGHLSGIAYHRQSDT